MEYERFYRTYVRPPFAPIYRPTAEEFTDPIAYVAKIKTEAEKYGVVKIIPPENFKPPFAINTDDFEFTPRIQRLNEVDVLTRERLFFADQVKRFWELQGLEYNPPIIDGRYIDLFTIHETVKNMGGPDQVTKSKTWGTVSKKAGLKGGSATTKVRDCYFNVIAPYSRLYKSYIESGQTYFWPAEKKEAQTECKEGMQGVRRNRQNGRMGSTPPKKNGRVKMKKSKDPMENVFCSVCSRGDHEDKLLLCEHCDVSMHIGCSDPPLKEVPKGEWNCPRCIVVAMSESECNFGFYDSTTKYSITNFIDYANDFKKNIFNNENVRDIPIDEVETKFWKYLMDPSTRGVDVKYGADLITSKVGSGFPRKCDEHRPPEVRQKMHYANHAWNLNNLPVLKESVLSHIETGISGMMVPWVYVGMCFSTFCWHTEDHWTYSINYNHWGEPKIWYGISGAEAEKFENVVRELAPNITGVQKDVFHHMTTAVNPYLLRSKGINVYTVHQKEGEFVITFPRAYHAGFNEGVNFAEAVNFAPIDWIKMGRQCVTDYALVRRPCVFSHDELVLKMVHASDKLGIGMSLAALEELKMMVERATMGNAVVHKLGITFSKKENFHEIADDQRACCYCNTTLFLTALSCPHHKSVCLDHIEFLCTKCSLSECVYKYSYTVQDLKPMLNKLEERTTMYFTWSNEVKDLFNRKIKPRMTEVQALLDHAKSKKFPTTESSLQLTSALKSCHACLEPAQALLNGKVRTRKETRIQRADTRLSIGDVEKLIEDMRNLPCNVEDTLSKLEERYEVFSVWKKEAADAIETFNKKKDSNYAVLDALIARGEDFDIRLDKLDDLKKCIRIRDWKLRVEELLAWRCRINMEEDDDFLTKTRWELDNVLKLIKEGAEIVKDQPLNELISNLHARYKTAVQMDNMADSLRDSKDTTIEDVENNWASCRESDWCTARGIDWLRKEYVQAQSYCNEIEDHDISLIDVTKQLDKCQKSTVLSSTKLYQQKLNIKKQGEILTKRLVNLFLKPTSYHTLAEVLKERDDIVALIEGRDVILTLHNSDDPLLEWQSLIGWDSFDIVKKNFSFLREQRRRLLSSLQIRNEQRRPQDTCVCQSDKDSCIITCLLCNAKYHVGCCDWDNFLGKLPEGSFLCVRCLKTRRPCLEDVVAACNVSHEMSIEGALVRELVEVVRTDSLALKEIAGVLGDKPPSEWPKEITTKARTVIEDILSLEVCDLNILPKLSSILNVLYSDIIEKQRSACFTLKETPVRSNPSELLFTSPKKTKSRKPIDNEAQPKRKRVRHEVHEEQEYCAFKECLRPCGKKVGWVQCEKCTNWYHLVCVGLTVDTVNNIKEYRCQACICK